MKNATYAIEGHSDREAGEGERLDADASRRFAAASQKASFYFVAVAWLIGTLLFEIASGASPGLPTNEASPGEKWPPQPMIDQILDKDMVKSVLTADMNEMLSLGVQVSVPTEQVASEKVADQETADQEALPESEEDNRESPALAEDLPAMSEVPTAIIPDSLSVDPVMEPMPFNSWVTRMAYRQLDRQYKLVGLKKVTEKRIALDLARQSAMPGLMRIVVSPPTSLAPRRTHRMRTASTTKQTKSPRSQSAELGRSI